MNSLEIRGRFLPSRVYCRWKWTVRFGLLLVPFLIFLCGGLILYLTPSKYRSTTLIELVNGPPPPETVELIKSRGILELVSEHLDLVKRMDVDRDTTLAIVGKSTEVKVVPDTRLIEIAVTLGNKVESRDTADEISNSLREYLVRIAKQANSEKAAELDSLIRDATDQADEKVAALSSLEKVHGATPADDTAATLLQRSRRASLLADAEVERLRVLRSECLTGNLDTLPRLVVHSAPSIAEEPFNPKIGPELDQLIVQALVCGLLGALLLPYLMELAFPPRRRPVSEPNPVIDL